jgi:hypothetical protein
MSEQLERVRDQALELARGWSGPDTPVSWRLTAALFEELAADAALLQLAGEIPPEKLPPLLFVASVKHLVARYPDEPFAAYFPVPGGDQPPLDDRFASRYRQLCLDHRDELAGVWDRHVYQMSEVARTTQVALALGAVRELRPDRAVALVDIGAGAGFGLHPDRYGYVLGDGRRFGVTTSPVELSCDLRGPFRPPLPELPAIAHRVGIDVNPIDLDDEASRRWLHACIPPEVGALRRLDGAIDVARQEHPLIVQGTCEEALPGVLEGFPDDLLVCIVDSYTAVFFDDDALRRLRERIATFGRDRDVAWISLDPLVPLGTSARHTVHGGEAPDTLVEQNRRGGVFAVLSVLAHLDGESTTRLLAAAHPSGTWMEWLSP